MMAIVRCGGPEDKIFNLFNLSSSLQMFVYNIPNYLLRCDFGEKSKFLLKFECRC